MLREACKHNICKINVDSDLRLAYTAGVREYLYENPSDVDIRNYSKSGMKNVSETVAYKMKNVFLSSGKAE